MDGYRESYLRKKEQMSAQQNARVIDASANLGESSSRSQSPAARSTSVNRRASVSNSDQAQSKKIVFRNELEEHKKQLAEHASAKADGVKAEVLQEVNALKEQFVSIQVKLEATKTEHLKQVLNESIKQSNDNIQQITAELSKHMSTIGDLVARVEEIESMLS